MLVVREGYILNKLSEGEIMHSEGGVLNTEGGIAPSEGFIVVFEVTSRFL